MTSLRARRLAITFAKSPKLCLPSNRRTGTKSTRFTLINSHRTLQNRHAIKNNSFSCICTAKRSRLALVDLALHRSAHSTYLRVPFHALHGRAELRCAFDGQGDTRSVSSVMSGSTKVFPWIRSIRYVNITVGYVRTLIWCAVHGWVETNENSETGMNLQNAW